MKIYQITLTVVTLVMMMMMIINFGSNKDDDDKEISAWGWGTIVIFNKTYLSQIRERTQEKLTPANYVICKLFSYSPNIPHRLFNAGKAIENAIYYLIKFYCKRGNIALLFRKCT